MVHITLSTLTIGLATLITALPATRDTTPSTSEFTIALDAEGYPLLSLNAVESGTPGTLDLVFEREAAYPGTPAYLSDTYLDFNYTGADAGIYQMYFQNVGDNYGISVPVTAVSGVGRSGFGEASDGTITATLTAALQSFFACNRTVSGEEQLTLNWGVFQTNGSAPEGCVTAQLIANNNVEA